MSAQSTGVMRVARTVANGEGDWAEVPSAVRDAILLALTQASTVPLRSLDGSPLGVSTGAGAGAVANMSPHPSSSVAPSILTEGNVQSSIQTFEDAAWVRDEAVRSYAEFHNSVESLHAAMRTQLHPVWKTAMQLRPGVLADVRDRFRLSRMDVIPDGVPITPASAQHIAQQEMILDEVEDTLQMLRNTSVRFAAHFLSDEEKISMGANPAYLRAPDIDREVVETRARSATPPLLTATVAAAPITAVPPTIPTTDDASMSPQQQHRFSHSHTHKLHDEGLVNSKTSRRGNRGSNAAAARTAASASQDDSSNHHRTHRETRERRRTSNGNTAAAAAAVAINDPLLEELRRQYQHRVKELENKHRRASPAARQGAWQQAGSVSSSRSSQTHSSSHSRN